MEAFGAGVDWDPATRQAIVIKDGTVVKVPIGKKYILVNGKQVAIDTSAVIQNGRTYLPIRAVVEAFGGSVEWSSTFRTVFLSSKGKDAYGVQTIVGAVEVDSKIYDMVTERGYQISVLGTMIFSGELYVESTYDLHYPEMLIRLMNREYSISESSNPNVDGSIVLNTEEGRYYTEEITVVYEGIRQMNKSIRTIEYKNGKKISIIAVEHNVVYEPNSMFSNLIMWNHTLNGIKTGASPYEGKVLKMETVLKYFEIEAQYDIYFSEELKTYVLKLID